MEQGKTATRTERKTYSNSFRSLEAIWEVLRRHSSPRRPLTVREICGYLKEWEEKGKDGRVRLIHYEEWEDRLAAKERRGGERPQSGTTVPGATTWLTRLSTRPGPDKWWRRPCRWLRRGQIGRAHV